VTIKVLAPKEVQMLTGKKRCNAQVRELNFMGINHRQRTDGTVVVVDIDVPVSLSTPKEVCFTING
jgi:hypothetical protein